MCIGNRYINFLSLLYIVIQCIFILDFYTDPCRKNPKLKCKTDIPHWKIWQVWLPSLVAACCSGLLMVGILVYACIPTNKELIKQFKQHGSFDKYFRFTENENKKVVNINKEPLLNENDKPVIYNEDNKQKSSINNV